MLPLLMSPALGSVRMQKLEALKAARQATGSVGGKRGAEEVDAAAAAAAAAIAEPEVQRPVIHLPKKRRVSCGPACPACRAAVGRPFPAAPAAAAQGTWSMRRGLAMGHSLP
jgi:hypothetical protein